MTPPEMRPITAASAEGFLDRSDEYAQETQDILRYGLEEQITERIDELSENKDNRFVNEIYDLFFETRNSSTKEKILDYFANLKDPCLASFAVPVINNPYDEQKP